MLCPFSQEYPREQRNAFLDRLNDLLGGILANESKVLSQAFYYGTVDGSAAPHIVLLNGAPIDLIEGLTENGKPGTQPGKGAD